MRLYFDTSVLVASALKSHVHHVAARAALEQVLGSENRGFVAAHGLAEFHAVLTRMPTAPPVYPGEAWPMRETNVLPHFTLIALAAKEYRDLLSECATQGWTGGGVYDALHLRSAQKANCEHIYTFSIRHFRELATAALRENIVSP
jgi:predicted nucleic acid-binding protein